MAQYNQDDIEYVLTPILAERDNKPECNFRLIGIRTFIPKSLTEEGEICVRRMQKSLFGKNDWFYFHTGYKIEDLRVTVEENAMDDMFLYRAPGKPTINISAIVGQNGAGKSTMVDMVIRILNNLSAAIIGERNVYEGAEHLHYIENVYGELAVSIKDDILVVKVDGRKITLRRYKRHKDSNIFRISHKDTVEVLNDTVREPHVLEPQTDRSKLLEDWFYTIICNYSLYSFNYRDYYSERTDSERLKILGKKISAENADDAFWLKGVFHKNDSYQTPVVIHPMRINGIIDAVKENYLAKERLISLLFEKDDNGKYLFRDINGTHRIVGLLFLQRDYYEYNQDQMCETLGLSAQTSVSKNFEAIYNCIIGYWKDRYKFDHEISTGIVKQAEDYIVYKTLKIAKVYKQYRKLWKTLRRKEFDADACKKLLDEVYKDRSHITTKLRRTLSYLTFHKTSEDYLANGVDVSLDKVGDWIGRRIREGYDKIDFALQYDELLPPPVFDVQFQIVEIAKIAADGSYDAKDVILFQGLSSGERQIAYSISNLMYHLYNINSASSDYNSDDEHQAMVRYRYVNVMFDEVELYFHPELQRNFVKYIVSALHSVTLSAIKGINIVMITHSPFVLSDIPDTNVVFLCKDGQKNPYGYTYGANIHAMLNNRFMMESTIGEHARMSIDKLLVVYHEKNEDVKRRAFVDNKALFRYLTEHIGDDYLRKVVTRMYRELAVKYDEQESILIEIQEHEARIKELKKHLPK